MIVIVRICLATFLCKRLKVLVTVNFLCLLATLSANLPVKFGATLLSFVRLLVSRGYLKW